MKKIVKFLLFITLFLFSFWAFFPKEQLYYFLEKELEKKKVVISDEILKEDIFSLNTKEAKIYFEGINVSKVEYFSFKSYIFYSKVEISNMVLIDTFSNFAPSPIESLVITHNLLNPIKIDIKSHGLFGDLNGEIDLLSRVLKIELKQSNIMKSKYSNILKNMRFEDGRYIYEYKF